VDTRYCEFCGERLDWVQEFQFLVEAQNLDEPAVLERIRQLPDASGVPLLICKACQASVKDNEREIEEEALRDQGYQMRLYRVSFIALWVIVLIVFTLSCVRQVMKD
jgi:hypothetical protein